MSKSTLALRRPSRLLVVLLLACGVGAVPHAKEPDQSLGVFNVCFVVAPRERRSALVGVRQGVQEGCSVGSQSLRS
jgi:hypothetical protein